ncbi:hypothetical protein SPLC1_S050630 [Arthrospira platensis C1]|nr:hypothetical protein SPLC1_S050630 [Arthrospira platensis C1]
MVICIGDFPQFIPRIYFITLPHPPTTHRLLQKEIEFLGQSLHPHRNLIKQPGFSTPPRFIAGRPLSSQHL